MIDNKSIVRRDQLQVKLNQFTAPHKHCFILKIVLYEVEYGLILSVTEDRDSMKDEQLNSFIEEHDMHLLADPTENIPVGSIYEMDPLVLKCRRVGTVANFVEPPVTLPDPDKKKRGNIARNFRNTGQTIL